MRAGFKVENRIWKGCKVIVCTNFHYINEVVNYGREADFEKEHYMVGVWRRKVEVGGGLVKKAEDSEVKNNKQ